MPNQKELQEQLLGFLAAAAPCKEDLASARRITRALAYRRSISGLLDKVPVSKMEAAFDAVRKALSEKGDWGGGE